MQDVCKGMCMWGQPEGANALRASDHDMTLTCRWAVDRTVAGHRVRMPATAALSPCHWGRGCFCSMSRRLCSAAVGAGSCNVSRLLSLVCHMSDVTNRME